MPIWLVSWIVFCAVGLVFPACFLFLAWRRSAKTGLMIIPFLAIIVLALSLNHDVRWILIGADYTLRLYVSIAACAILTLINATIAVARRAWLVGIASALLSLVWFFLGAVNSAV